MIRYRDRNFLKDGIKAELEFTVFKKDKTENQILKELKKFNYLNRNREVKLKVNIR